MSDSVRLEPGRDNLQVREPHYPWAKGQRISTKLCLWVPQRQIS